MPWWPLQVRACRAADTSQTRTVWSKLAEARRSPSARKATAVTAPRWPARGRTSWAGAESRRRGRTGRRGPTGPRGRDGMGSRSPRGSRPVGPGRGGAGRRTGRYSDRSGRGGQEKTDLPQSARRKGRTQRRREEGGGSILAFLSLLCVLPFRPLRLRGRSFHRLWFQNRIATSVLASRMVPSSAQRTAWSQPTFSATISSPASRLRRRGSVARRGRGAIVSSRTPGEG